MHPGGSILQSAGKKVKEKDLTRLDVVNDKY
jgi:hypothetical protein